jgi:hypothetical protein
MTKEINNLRARVNAILKNKTRPINNEKRKYLSNNLKRVNNTRANINKQLMLMNILASLGIYK